MTTCPCGKAFQGVAQRRYCSLRCRRRFYMRSYRKSDSFVVIACCELCKGPLTKTTRTLHSKTCNNCKG